MKNLLKLSKLHYDILKLVESSAEKGVTTTEMIQWGVNTRMSNCADRRARELRENGYLSESEVNDNDMAIRGLKTKVNIFRITESGSVWIKRLADTMEAPDSTRMGDRVA